MLRAKLERDVIPEAEIGGDARDGAEVAGLDEGADCAGKGEEARPEGFHEEEAALGGDAAQDGALRCCDCDGFLDEHVFVSMEGEQGVLEVVRVRGGNVDDVYIWIFDQLLVGAVCFCGAGGVDFGEEGLGAGGGG